MQGGSSARHGAATDIRSRGGLTPLHWVRGGDTAKALLNASADINAKDDAGLRPLDRALSWLPLDRAVVDVLRAGGGL